MPAYFQPLLLLYTTGQSKAQAQVQGQEAMARLWIWNTEEWNLETNDPVFPLLTFSLSYFHWLWPWLISIGHIFLRYPWDIGSRRLGRTTKTLHDLAPSYLSDLIFYHSRPYHPLTHHIRVSCPKADAFLTIESYYVSLCCSLAKGSCLFPSWYITLICNELLAYFCLFFFLY